MFVKSMKQYSHMFDDAMGFTCAGSKDIAANVLYYIEIVNVLI